MIDDDFINNIISQKVIRSLNLTSNIICLKDGEEGINLIKKNIKEKTPLPELIFLDIHMAKMDGFEFLEQMKILNLAAPPNIIVLTTSSNPKELMRLKEQGIKYIWNKPLSKEKLLEFIEEDSFCSKRPKQRSKTF